jgi:hypothetical protein
VFLALQIEACQTHATALLEDQPDNEDAAIMLAELMAHQVSLWLVQHIACSRCGGHRAMQETSTAAWTTLQLLMVPTL